MTTTNIALTQPAYGSTTPTWDNPLNTNASIIDQAFGWTINVTVSATGNTLISSPTSSGNTGSNNYSTGGTSQCMRINLTGTPTANINVLLPYNVAGMWTVSNNTTGTFTVTLGSANSGGTPNGGATVALTRGYSTLVFVSYNTSTSVYDVKKADDATTSASVSSFSAGSTGLTPSSASTGAITLAGTLVPANGGTGLTSPGTSGNVLTSNGTAWVSQAPTTGGSYTAGNGISISSNKISMTGSYPGTFTATTSLSSPTITATSGNITASSGSITASGNITATGTVNAGGSYPQLQATGGYSNFNFSSNTGISYNGLAQINYAISGTTQLVQTTSQFTCNVTPYANQTAWSIISDVTEKQNISTITDGAQRINALKPVNFTWITTQKTDSGFIAQDFETVYPNNITVDENGKKRIGINMNFYADLVSTIQSLQQQITALEARLTAHNL